jgi:hypothetical protein
MHALPKNIEAIKIINANAGKYFISKFSLIMTNAIQVKTMARNGINFFIGKYTKNYLRMCVPFIYLTYPALFLI